MPATRLTKIIWQSAVCAVLALTVTPISAQQTDCKGLNIRRDTVQAHWHLAVNEKMPRPVRLQHFQTTLDLSLQCPELLADTAILAAVQIIQLQFNLDSLNAWLDRTERYVETCRPYLSPGLLFLTDGGVRFEKYRHLTTLGYYDQAIDGFQALIDDLPQNHSGARQLQEANYAYRLYLGWLNYKKGNYPQALEWYTLAHPYLPEWDFEYSTAHFEHLGMISMALENDEKAKEYLFESERRFYSAPDTLRPNPEYLFYTYLDLVEIFSRQQDRDSTFLFLEKARQLDIPNPWTYVHLKKFEGQTFLKNKAYDEAILAFEAGLELADSLFAGKQFRKGELLLGIGEAHLTRQTPLPALKFIQKSLAHFEDSFNAGDFSQNPQIEHSPLKFELLRALNLKGKAIFAQSRQEKQEAEWLQMALATLSKAIDLIQILRNDYDYDESKELLSEMSFQVFEQAIETAHQLYRITNSADCMGQAFVFAEKSKALSLLESLTDIGAKHFANLSDSLLQQETDLKLQIAFYERKSARANAVEDIAASQSAAFELRRKLQQLRKKMEVENPDYFNMKYQLPTPDIEILRGQLSEDESFVEYFWGDRNLYFFSISKDTVHWGALPADDHLRKQVEDFKNLAASRTALVRPSNMKKFSRLGYQLFHQLIEPLHLKKPKVLLAADAWLNLLPFDALLTDSLPRNDYIQFPFLIFQRQITRVFSASVLTQDLKINKIKPEKPLLVIAPNEQLQGRPDSLAAQFGGEFLLNENAGRQQVFDRATRFQNLLFYAHAEADTIEPFIHLSGHEKLFLKDLYAQPVPAELVVLAACEAGTGQVKRGEGVMSLARGFAYGGASNVGLTLWEVQSGTTLRLAGDFLSGYFEKNLSPAEAIYHSKLNFLERPPLGDASPYLWSGFVLVGR